MSTDPDGWAAERERIRALDPDVAAELYASMAAKRQTLDQMMWQTPALGLVAHSFLLTIALGAGVSWTARIVAACLGIVAAAGSIQLLLKHRYHEEMQSLWLEQFASARDWPGATPNRVLRLAYEDREHVWTRSPRTALTWHRQVGHAIRERLTRRSSPYVWIGVLAVFALAEAAIFVIGLVDLAGGGSAL